MSQFLEVNIFDKSLKLKDGGKTLKVIYNIAYGKNGCTFDKLEGDGKTPLGLYKVGKAFGKMDFDGDYPYLKITENSYWVDDVNSKYYNKWVEGNKGFKSFEHLIDYKEYELGLIIEYNTENTIAGAGSAIFIHVKNGDYTNGCIALDKEDLFYIINWLDWAKSPHILIRK